MKQKVEMQNKPHNKKRYRNGESVELRGKNAGSAKGQKIDVKNTPDRETRKP